MKQRLFYFDILNTCTTDKLRILVTKYQATEEIKSFLLNVQQNGHALFLKLVKERLVSNGEEKLPLLKFQKASIKSKTVPLHDVKMYGAQNETFLNADRYIFQHMIISYDAGREIDLDDHLRHELLLVPLSLANMDGSLRKGQKSILMPEI